MADFAKWATAAEISLGWRAGSFLEAYRNNREGASEAAVGNDPVAAAVRSIMAEKDYWEGSASELLSELETDISESVRRSRTWPSAANSLTARLTRVAPALRAVGIDIQRARAVTKDRKRLILIQRMFDRNKSLCPN